MRRLYFYTILVLFAIVLCRAFQLTEVHYAPLDEEVDPATNDNEVEIDGDEYEFIEFQNVFSTPYNVGGLSFDDGIVYSFPSVTLAPGEFFVIASNALRFEQRYKMPPNGTYDGKLNNDGERLSVRKFDETLPRIEITYNDAYPWPVLANGHGHSLHSHVSPPPSSSDTFDIDLSLSWKWSASETMHGTPFTHEHFELPKGTSVRVNEVLSLEDPTSTEQEKREEFIELFNDSEFDVDLSGWCLSDKFDRLCRYVIPSNSSIKGFGYYVIARSELDFGISSNGGEDAIVSDPSGTYAHYIGVPKSAVGLSFGFASDARQGGSNGDVSLLAKVTRGRANSNHFMSPLLITEVHYHPGDDQVPVQYVRVECTQRTDLSRWRVNGFEASLPSMEMDVGASLLIVGATLETLPDGSQASEASEVARHWAQSSVFRDYFDEQLDQTVTVVSVDADTKALSYGGDRIRLQHFERTDDDQKAVYVTYDEIDFEDRAPWPEHADGHGRALRRVSLRQRGTRRSNWQSVRAFTDIGEPLVLSTTTTPLFETTDDVSVADPYPTCSEPIFILLLVLVFSLPCLAVVLYHIYAFHCSSSNEDEDNDGNEVNLENIAHRSRSHAHSRHRARSVHSQSNRRRKAPLSNVNPFGKRIE